MRRRDFLKSGTAFALPALGIPLLTGCRSLSTATRTQSSSANAFKISLNQWSLWSSYVGDDSAPSWWQEFVTNLRTNPAAILKGTLDPLDFPKLAREAYGLDAIELEGSLYFGHANDHAYFHRLRRRCDDWGVRCLFVSNGWLGSLSGTDARKPRDVAGGYHAWIDIAAILGCHSLMVGVERSGDKKVVKDAAVEGLSALVEYARTNNITVITENHRGHTTDAVWLVDVIRTVDSPFCGLNVDLGNFCRAWANAQCVDQQFDPYEGVRLMMPYARAVSAKTIRFDEQGNDTRTDYVRMLRIISDSGYTGYLGVECAGGQFSDDTGIRMTIDLIERAASQL